ncbi:class I SAM-dependent methyltransferase [Hymenobacter sp. BT175]|uniref:class I SAM-dependent methyltransferase n=1 Tax=Hymenobacter translucens TaxID=2886507 RepID=UPI001D0DFDB3|nr:class I SAM-dependent methyltransferase [Hymenobacter translucens]MCC2545879.1 class I SAM-dependent methyltransferase [Hymenobacter translucens]
MHPAYEQTYHQLEEQHWWFAARRSAVFDLVGELRVPSDAAILEIGCSGGPLLLALRKAGYHNLTGIDLSEKGIALAQARGFSNVSVMDGARLEFADNSFDLVIASDVLEHIEDDAQALREWQRVLRPGGRLIVFVPAFPFLWSRHDEVNYHFRRYTGTDLRKVLTTARLQVERLSYWNFTLFFPTSVVRMLQRKTQATIGNSNGDLLKLPTVLNKSLRALIGLENLLLRRINLPVGVSTFAIARKAD